MSTEFDKLAARVPVRPYIRQRDGHAELVGPYTREQDVAPDPAQKAEEHKVKKTNELALWREWKTEGMPKDKLRQLIKGFEPMVSSIHNKYAGNVRIPPAAIRAELYKQLLAALETYNPDRGAALGTHVYTYLSHKVKRFVATNQNFARIVEKRIYHIHDLQTAEQELNEEMGRPATDLELSGFLGWKLKDLLTLKKERRKALWSSAFEESGEEGARSAPGGETSTKDEQISHLIRHELTEKERKVYDLLMSGSGKVRTKDIAEKLKIPAYDVSRVRGSIAAKIDKYST